MEEEKKVTSTSPSKDKLYSQEYKSNLVLRPDGQAAWDKKIWMWEPGKNLKPKKRFDDPSVPTDRFMGKKEADADLKWIIPRHYCPDCRRSNISVEVQKRGTSGMFVFLTNHPECDITVKDAVVYGRCGDCLTMYRNGSVVQLPGGTRDAIRLQQLKIEDGILDYIKQQKLRGETAIEERYRD